MCKHYEKDIFISYTHLDNKPLTKEQEGWITSFHYSLQIRLGQLLGREPIIWRDNKLHGNDEFSDEIIAQFPKVKILLSILSPRYIQSKWCQQELEEFHRIAMETDGIRLGNKSRIFKIIKTPVPYQQHPPEIRGLLGYNFFLIDAEDRFHEFNSERGSPYYHYYFERLEDVAQDLCQLIKQIEKTPTARRTVLSVSPPEKTVFLAETTSDLEDDRDNIRRDLHQQGYTILPEQPLPIFLKDGNFKDIVRECLSRCRLSIHLIGNQYGVIPEGEQRSIIDLQNELTTGQCQTEPLIRLIWTPIDLILEDERHKNFISTLQNTAPSQQETQLVQSELEDFKTIIQDTLKAISRPPEKKVSYDGPDRIYLIYDEPDRKEVKVIDDCLFDEGFEVLTPLFRDDETQLRKIHQEYLRLSDAMMIYYNHANEFWLNTKLNDLRKAYGYGRSSPIRARAVYITGKRTPHKERFRTHEADVIRHFAPFKGSALESFLSKLHNGNGGGR